MKEQMYYDHFLTTMFMKISFINYKDSYLFDPEVYLSFVSRSLVYFNLVSLSLVYLSFYLSCFNYTYSHSLFFKDSL